jgi:hypothetical protein
MIADVGWGAPRDPLRQIFTVDEFHHEGVGQDRDRDLTAQRRVRRPIDLPHAALTDRRGDFVDAESAAGLETHGFEA